MAVAPPIWFGGRMAPASGSPRSARVATGDGPCLHLVMTTRAWMSWSSGKDSTFALQCLEAGVEVAGLLVTVNESADRVAMHAVRTSLLEQQADRLGLPLHVVAIPSPCPNKVYETRMGEAMDVASREGVGPWSSATSSSRTFACTGSRLWHPPASCPYSHSGHAPHRHWRAARSWQRHPGRPHMRGSVPTAPVIRRSPVRRGLLHDLPATVDPCGERGEFHTFVWDAPSFSSPIPIRTGERVTRGGFVFCDVLPGEVAE